MYLGKSVFWWQIHVCIWANQFSGEQIHICIWANQFFGGKYIYVFGQIGLQTSKNIYVFGQISFQTSKYMYVFGQISFQASKHPRCRTIVSCGDTIKSIYYPIILFLQYKQYIILNIVYVLFTSHTIQSCGSEGCNPSSCILWIFNPVA